MAEVRLEKLTKRFGQTDVLKAIDLTIREGEFFALVGPSGCGKSTLLNLIAGLEVLAQGEIYFDGQPISHLAPKDRDVAMVFQSYALYPHMTVYENLAFPLRIRKVPSPEMDRQIRKVAELLDLGSVIFHKPRELSGGQRQRVALGRAMVRQPRVFLLDEPLSNLDAQLRIEMRSELKKLHAALGVTAIYVTHDQAEAMTLSDRMAVLHQGVIQQCGTPAEVYDQPANLFVAGFIGSPPMNLLDGTLSKGPGFIMDFGEGAPYPLSQALRERIKGFPPGRRLVLGVRPEHLQILKLRGGKGIPVRLVLIEPMGSETWVEATWGHQRLRIKAPAGFNEKVGETIHLEMDEAKVHFFNAETGIRLL